MRRHLLFVGILIVFCTTTCAARGDMISPWKQVDLDTLAGDSGSTTLTLDNDVEVFTAATYDPAVIGFTSITMSFEAFASSDASIYTISIPSTYRFDDLYLVGVNGSGSIPTLQILTPGVEWSITEVLTVNGATTEAKGQQLNYHSPFVAHFTGLAGLTSIQFSGSDQTEDDPLAIGAQVRPVPEPTSLLLMPLAAAMFWRRRRTSIGDIVGERQASA